MTTDELIEKLREVAENWAPQSPADETSRYLREAADRLEELDERVAIMMSN